MTVRPWVFAALDRPAAGARICGSAANLKELVENSKSERLGNFLVTEVNRLEVIPSGLSTHENVTVPDCLFPPTSVGYILNESAIPPRVTF